MTPPNPLSGIRVLEVANWLAVPACGALMADLGADVVKVEPPGGDAWRSFRLESLGFPEPFPTNYAFQLDNRGKRSVILDLGVPQANQAVLRLAERADVFLTNLVPERRERYGLTPAQLAARNPRLVYLGFSGYGPAGPDRDRLGFDYAAFWARSGIMGLMGEPGGPPPPQRPGLGDHVTAPLLLAGVLAALFERERSGAGQEVSGSLLNSGLWVLGTDVQAALVAHQAPNRLSRQANPNPIWNTYQTGDGSWLMLVMPQPDPYWPKVCQAIGRPDLAADPRYATMDGRRAACRDLIAILEAVFLQDTRRAWGARLDEAGVIWAPVQALPDVMDDPQVRDNRMLAQLEHPELGAFETVDTPVKFSRSEVGARTAAPEPGQHTEEVLLEAGYTWEEIGELRERGVFG